MPKSLVEVVEHLERLPGIGYRSAMRIVLYLLGLEEEQRKQYMKGLDEALTRLRRCEECGNISDDSICVICRSDKRTDEQILIVGEAIDTISIEESGAYNGKYHVLGKLMSPVSGVGPDDLNIELLVKRIQERLKSKQNIEIILAMPKTLEGEATETYISRVIQQNFEGISITSLARGLPGGAEINYADSGTIRVAINERSKKI